MRDAAFACIRRVGVETGGSNVQFAVDPTDGRQVVIEMNPRVSRSSALASKATGFPSPRSPPAWPWATGWTRSPTTSPGPPRHRSSRPSTTCHQDPRWRSRSFRRHRRARHPDAVGGEVMGSADLPESLQKAVRSLEQAATASMPTRLRPPSSRGPPRSCCRRWPRHPRADLPGGVAASPRRLGRPGGRGHRIDPCSSRPWPRSPTPDGPRPPGHPGGHRRRRDRRGWRRLKQLGYSDEQLPTCSAATFVPRTSVRPGPPWASA